MGGTVKGRKRGGRATHGVAPARTRVDVDRGVRDCMALMVANQWVSGTSHQEIADKHGVVPATVKNWATSASRVLRELMSDDIEEIRARLVAKTESIGSMAVAAGEYRTAVAGVELEAKLAGLLVQKHEVDVTVQAFQKLPLDQQVASAKQQIRELQAFVDQAEGRA